MSNYGWVTYTVNAGTTDAMVQSQNRMMRDMLGRFVPVAARERLFTMPKEEKLKTKYLNSTGSPSCCGIHWLTSFPEIPRSSLTGKYDYANNDHLRTDVDEDLTKIFANAGAREYSYERQVYVNNVMLVVLNNVQRVLYHDILLKHGFTVIQEEAYTDKTGHLLTIYSKLKHPNIKEATDK